MKHFMNFKRGAAVLSAIAMAVSVSAQTENYVPKHEFSISGFGGLSTLNYKVNIPQNPYIDGVDRKMGLGGGVGLDWTYHFSKHWGLRLGLQGALYTSKAETSFSSDDRDFTWQLATDNYWIAKVDGSFVEKQRAVYAQVPLMVQWMTPVGEHNFYAALGGKFGYRIWDNYKVKETEGDYAWNTQDYIDLKRINAMASAELGMRWTLGNGVGLYTGLYFDYGFLKVNDKKVENGSIINSLYYDQTQKQLRAVDKVNTMAGGLILRLSFGKPAVIAPVCEPCPGPQTVIREKHITIHDTIYVEKEVPQEIKQKMKDLSNALFAFDKFNINTKAASILDDIAGWMKQNPDMKLELSGHTDGKGSVDYNQKLSEQRAKAVYDYLVKAGVSKTNLTWKGYGKSEPIATNDTAEGRQLNRRVELRIVK